MYFCDTPGPLNEAPRSKERKSRVKLVHDHCRTLPGHELEI